MLLLGARLDLLRIAGFSTRIAPPAQQDVPPSQKQRTHELARKVEDLHQQALWI